MTEHSGTPRLLTLLMFLTVYLLPRWPVSVSHPSSITEYRCYPGFCPRPSPPTLYLDREVSSILMSTITLYKVTTSKWVSWIGVPLLRATSFFSNYSFDKLHLNSCGFPGGSVSKQSACNAGDLGLIPGLGRSPGEGNGNPLQYSCMENSMDRGTWWAAVHGGHKELDMIVTFFSLELLQ